MSTWFDDLWEWLGWLFFHEQVTEAEEDDELKKQEEELEDWE